MIGVAWAAVEFSISCMICGETVVAPKVASGSTLRDTTTRTIACPRCHTTVEFIYNSRHQPFGARLVTTD
jgi:endogenous inhibitor of DNA gyrase (YacG/DUF329 family)